MRWPDKVGGESYKSSAGQAVNYVNSPPNKDEENYGGARKFIFPGGDNQLLLVKVLL